ncbi:hypothetical protein CK203_092087 [Vitis vinifera]|uniref:Uncharacterized protein n=1 Tax=Vitis vinifera TaxID=29760 RepID=A0A438CL89_VITVI|nr:hypothetical protein CK203_092087 [Vitis vinifera]
MESFSFHLRPSPHPLPPYLFILAMKTLSRILSKAKEGGDTDGFLVRSRNGFGVEVSHLLFVDNTLVLYDVNKEKLEHWSWVYMWFEA